MKLLVLAITAAALVGCNFMDAMRQTDPNRSDKPVIFSDAWKRERADARLATEILNRKPE